MPSSCRFILKDSHPALQELVLKEEKDVSLSTTTTTTTTNDTTSSNNKPRGMGFFRHTLLKRNGMKRELPQDDIDNEDEATTTRDIEFDENGNPIPTDMTNTTTATTPSTTSTSNNTKLQGRFYNTKCSLQEGGLKISEMTLGMKYACMSITDDTPGTLQKVGVTNPWQIQGMKLMLRDCIDSKTVTATGTTTGTGTTESTTTVLENEEYLNEEIHKPLSYLLPKYYNNLIVDCHIDVSGWKGLHVFDTQGYIAHNDTTIVLAYRCTTSGYDWLTNLATTTSLWETEDIERGHSGLFSGIHDHFKKKVIPPPGERRNRVHTGFYNNFISSVPSITKYIDPLLADTSKPRTLYICGHSLGGGIAHMAFAYFLLEHQKDKYNWSTLPHRLLLVTAGSPRAYQGTMQKTINEKMKHGCSYPNQIQCCRLVRDKDTVSTVPPSSLGFKHVDKFVYITKDNAILINPNLKNVVNKKVFHQLLMDHPTIQTVSSVISDDENCSSSNNNNNDNENNNSDSESDDEDVEGTKKQVLLDSLVGNNNTTDKTDEQIQYEKKLQFIPRSLRDHMPEFYLIPLMNMYKKEREDGSILEPSATSSILYCTSSMDEKKEFISHKVTSTGEETFDIVYHGTSKTGGGSTTTDHDDVVVDATTTASSTPTPSTRGSTGSSNNNKFGIFNKTSTSSANPTLSTTTPPTSPGRKFIGNFKGLFSNNNNNNNSNNDK